MSGDADGFDPVALLERAVPVASNGGVGETRDLLVETLEAEDVDPTVDDAGNTVASRGAAEPATHLVLSTHIDTISPYVPYDRNEGVIHGRGSCDAKGPLAALLSAFFTADPGPDARVALAITSDEEPLSTGAVQLDLDGDRYIVGEPTGLDVYTVTKGRFEGTVPLSGVVAHVAEPQSGVNAADALAPVLDMFRSFDDDREAHPDLDPAVLMPVVVDGGMNSSQVSADCQLVVDRRNVPPETAEGFREEPESTLRAAVPDDVGADFALTECPTPFPEAFATDPGYELMTSLAAASRDAGRWVDVRPFTAAAKASYSSPAPVTVFSPGDLADDEGVVAHADREYVRTDDVRTVAAALRATVIALTA